MTRIIAGQWGGRRLKTPQGDGTRPTTDRVRESMFASLNSYLGGFEGLRVLDLFAGSGALGLEALSRGASQGDFVESDRRAALVIRGNLKELGVQGNGVAAQVHVTTAARFLAAPPTCAYDLVFLDPPYPLPTTAVGELLTALTPWRADDSLIVVERSSRDEWVWPDGLEGVQDRTYGETSLWYGR